MIEEDDIGTNIPSVVVTGYVHARRQARPRGAPH
jgi:hypothetical protein